MVFIVKINFSILEDSSVQKADKSLQKVSEVARIDSVKVEKIRSHSAKEDFLCLLEQANGTRISTDKGFNWLSIFEFFD